MNWAESTPYSFKLRELVDSRLTRAMYTEKEVLDSIMALAVQRETENQFTPELTKEAYFTVLHDLLTNILFKKK
jgi:hypothetical protein